jgi:hypothetical protein
MNCPEFKYELLQPEDIEKVRNLASSLIGKIGNHEARIGQIERKIQGIEAK